MTGDEEFDFFPAVMSQLRSAIVLLRFQLQGRASKGSDGAESPRRASESSQRARNVAAVLPRQSRANPNDRLSRTLDVLDRAFEFNNFGLKLSKRQTKPHGSIPSIFHDHRNPYPDNCSEKPTPRLVEHMLHVQDNAAHRQSGHGRDKLVNPFPHSVAPSM